jgi:hypothetical protein
VSAVFLLNFCSQLTISSFDTSVGRGEFDTKIGIGRVIRGIFAQILSMALNGSPINLTAFRMG